MLADLAGPKASGVFAFAYLTQCFSLALFGTSAAAYLGDIIPALNGHVARILVGGGLLTFFYVVNILGVDLMAKVQKLMTWFLIAALLLFAIFGLVQRTLPIFDFNDPNFLTQGWTITFENGQIKGGFLGAALLFLYSCNGYSMTCAYGRDAKNARKDIPIAMLAAVPTLIILYVGVAMAGTGVMSIEEYGDSTTLVFAAQRIFPKWLFYVFIIGGPIMALLSTLNSTFAYNAITIGQSCDDKWLPTKFGEKNSRGSRKYILTLLYIMGMIPIIFGLSITVITNMVQLVMAVLALLYTYAYVKMPKKYKKSWEKSFIHIPDGLYYVICALSFIIYAVTIWKSCLSMPVALAAGNIGIIIVLVIVALIRAQTGDITIHTSVWSGDEDK